MKTLLALSLCAAALVPPAAHAADVKRASGPSAAQIVARNVEARGGLEAWRAVRTLKLSGEMDAGGTSNAKLPFALSMKRPHKSRLDLTFAGSTATQVYDGEHGWKVRPFLNRDDVEPFTAAEARAAASAADLDGPLVDHARKGIRVELVGTDKVEGKKTYKLKLTLKGGAQRLVWIDATTFLETKISGEPRRLDGRPHDVAVFYRDYRAVKGLKVPHVLETVVAGVKGSHKMTIQTVAVNPPLNDELFAKPTAALAAAKAN